MPSYRAERDGGNWLDKPNAGEAASPLPLRDTPLSLTLAQTFKAEFARGGYLWTMAVNQTVGAVLAIVGYRRGMRPSQLTLLNVFVGVGTSGALIVLFPSAPVLVSIIEWLGWQLDYSLDCADGQLARSTATTSAAGFVLDLLSDFLVQTSVVSATLWVITSAAPEWWTPQITPLAAAGWLISPFYSGILNVISVKQVPGTRSLGQKIVQHSRDYGLHLAVLPVLIAISIDLTAAALLAISSLNYLALLKGLWSWSRTGA